MTIEDAKRLDHFICSECSTDDNDKRSQNGFAGSLEENGKVRPVCQMLGMRILVIVLIISW